ncbi:MAG: DegV family EDD domain-containing protein [Oscillospiraceae bacterium]|nr:DegV family EDD domain-containing protein [Oscillospiraceae bacterium]
MVKNLKKLVQSIWDRNLDLQERLFRLLVMVGLCGLVLGILDSIVIGEDMLNIAVMVAAFIVFLSIFYCSVHFHKTQVGAIVIAVLVIFAVLPFIFISSGGIYGGAPIWLLFGLFYVCLVVEGKAKYVLLGCGFVVDAACYYIGYMHPSVIIPHSEQTAHIDSAVSLFIVAALVCCMIIFQNGMFRSENAIAKKRKQEIEELNRAQNRFFSSMSHEIRTPINTIIGLNEMILRECLSDEVAKDALVVQGASKMLLSLINDFLDMSKIESGKMEIVPVTYNVGDMLSDIVNMIWVRAKEKGLEFHIDVDKSVPAKLIGDEVRIKQILINVLNNAVKYTSSGSVTLSIQSDILGQGIAEISYSITDTGMGIKKESMEHLFSAFKRADVENNRHIEGTGLGLAIVKQLLDLMDGNIAVNSVYTKGSTFVITLPQKIADDEKLGTFDLESRRMTRTKEHYKQSFEAPKAQILIVDDNEANLMVEEKLLKDTKAQVETVKSGEECLKKTVEFRYDVILMDHLMPGMDGIECLHAIRSQTGGLNQNTPVVVLTANAGGEYKELYKREGFDGYLLKPVVHSQLEAELLRHLPKNIVTLVGDETSVGVIETPVLTYNRKMTIMISTESVCDLPEEFLDKYQVAVIPYHVATEKGNFLDGIETESDSIISYMSEMGKNARSEEPSVSDYEEFFAEQLTKAQFIIHISMSKGVSKGYEHASEAAKAFDNVTVIDSGHLSSSMGIMSMYASECAASGMSVEEIIHEMEAMKHRIRTSFVMGSTEYLARSGRLSQNVSALCEAIMLHPVIVMKNSRMGIGAVRIGTEEIARKKYIASALKVMGEIDTRVLFITYAGLSRHELENIIEQVRSKVNFQKIICQKVSPAVATNCGPGTFGLLFMRK